MNGLLTRRIGCGLAIFASVLQELFYFKPQTIYISVIFLTVIAYILGEALATAIPRFGPLKYLNPFPFNSKEHAFIVIMASAGATSAVSTEILAAQRMYYNQKPNPGAAIFLVISSQLLGYGIAGLLRSILVQPSKMLWPINIPVNSLLETLHRDKSETAKRIKVFLIVFSIMFCWEIVPVSFTSSRWVGFSMSANRHVRNGCSPSSKVSRFSALRIKTH